ncbi:MAG: hypothetical protein J5778_01100 [Clostridiales bacterium]|nr:hypothetical protein [Clostridiales bacterium]
MGTGYHGGFGNTWGSDSRNRIGKLVPETERDYEMVLNPSHYASVISKKYGINLKGSGKRITIVYNPHLPLGIPGKTRKRNPYVIELGPSAFYSETELANTIAHELNHARDYIRGGTAEEKPAYASGDALENYIRGGR